MSLKFPSVSITDNSSHHTSEEISAKWKGVFITDLRSVARQVHPSLTAQDDALYYIEELMVQLLNTLCSTVPHTPQEVEDRVLKTFPDPIDKWAMRDAQCALERGKRHGLVLPVDKIHPLLKDQLCYRVDYQVAVYIVAVLEYIAADILKFTGIYVKNIRHSEITLQDIRVAICADQVLMDMFSQEEDISMIVKDEPVRRESMTYEGIVKDFIHEETQYMRDLNMIIKVFRAPFAELFPRSKDLEVIFSNILDIYNFTANLQSAIEDQVEIVEENEIPLVGTCFVDIAEGEEFNVYEKYVADMVVPHGKDRLYTLLQRDDVSKSLQSAGHGFRDAMKYVLPKLLMGPVYHCLHYFEVIKALIDTSPSEEDRECLEQANGGLQALKARLERRFSGSIPKRKPWEMSLRLQGHTGRTTVLQNMMELQKSIDGWEGKDICQSCSELIMEGVLNKHTRGRLSERHVFLFDGLIIMCKQNARRSSMTSPPAEYKLKERFFVRKVEILDKDDCGEECKNAFEIRPRDQNVHIMVSAKTAEEKANWMAALISLQTRSMLERTLDGKLKEEEKQHPLRLPPPDKYRFSEEDSEENIVFEDNQNPSYESPLIKGGTLLKLVERLTYHMYADPKFVRTFLTTYRSFCSPHTLLDLLIERFEIPDPIVEIKETDDLMDRDLKIREAQKRFRKEYVKPVQFRVVNVLRHWVDHHYYDFERDSSLLEKLRTFLDNVKGKAMKKMAESITKVINRRCESTATEREFIYQKQPPSIEWHLTRKPEEFELMTLHPIEIARQVTLLEFEMYRAVQPSELVGSVFVKKDKSKTSPNMLKISHFSTMFTFWLEKCIVETENLEERVAVVTRLIEIMIVFQELNNFNGVLEVVSALHSAPIYRLEHTFREVPHRYIKAFDEAKELNSDHYKKYIEKLRSINPPCVPFLGMYLTNILLTEEGNPDFLHNRPGHLINFSKRRKVAEITGEIQQYQNLPYCLSVENSIREFFENLNPLGEMGEKEFTDSLYQKSLEIEPRGLRPPKFPKRYEWSLKSPGVKPMAHRGSSSTRNASFPLPAPKYSEEEDSASPPTPSTPLTPPHSSSTSSVFDSGRFSSISSLNSQAASISSSLPSSGVGSSCLGGPGGLGGMGGGGDTCQLEPPPLPPRRSHHRRDPLSDLVTPREMHDPPVPPPRVDEDRPPPVPPRRDSMYPPHHNRDFNTLPRSQSVSHPRPAVQPPHSATLPRHNSERSFPGPPPMADQNGDTTPELPPKTYRYADSRNPSS